MIRSIGLLVGLRCDQQRGSLRGSGRRSSSSTTTTSSTSTRSRDRFLLEVGIRNADAGLWLGGVWVRDWHRLVCWLGCEDVGRRRHLWTGSRSRSLFPVEGTGVVVPVAVGGDDHSHPDYNDDSCGGSPAIALSEWRERRDAGDRSGVRKK
jgi:hypothetical protein